MEHLRDESVLTELSPYYFAETYGRSMGMNPLATGGLFGQHEIM